MNFRKLITYLTMGTAAAMPLAVAQNPTILQGSYISNVFGNSNFVLNPNAQTNTANVTVSSATVTRSTTTPLVATSEFLVTTSTSTGSATWSTRTFDGGMKGQNCEARFSYRGFSVGSTTAQILQGANVVAQLTLTASTDPRIASINFPCGDLSSATTFRLQQATASLTGTNEIGGIYVGLATNMANVAQAEHIGSWTMTNAANCAFGLSGTTYNQFNADADCNNPTVTGQVTASQGKRPWITITNGKPGIYYVVFQSNLYKSGTQDSNAYFRLGETTQKSADVIAYNATASVGAGGVITGTFTYTAAQQIDIWVEGKVDNASSSAQMLVSNANTSMKFDVYRFPSSSELVVTPERQNVFGGVSYAGSSDFSGTSTTVASVTDSTFGTRSFYGGASLAGTACGLTANDFGFCMTNVPPGTYQIAGNAEVGSVEAGTDKSFCNYKVRVGGTSLSDTEVINVIPHSNAWSSYTPLGTGIIKITAFQPTLRVWMSYNKDSLADSCNVRSTTSALSSALPSLQISPLDQPSNSAVYVEGPVKASATGAAIPAGYVGEEVTQATATVTTVTVSANTEVDVTNANITLGVGVWELQYFADVYIERTPASTSNIYGRIRITDSSNTLEANTESFFGNTNNASSLFSSFSSVSRSKRIAITSGTKTFKLRITCTQANTVGVCAAAQGDQTGAMSGLESSTYIRAVRLN